MQARILYDFDGDAENGELVASEGTELTILNQVSLSVCLSVCVEV